MSGATIRWAQPWPAASPSTPRTRVPERPESGTTRHIVRPSRRWRLDLSSSLANQDLTVIKANPTEQLVDTIRAAGATNPDAIILASPPLADARVEPFGRPPCDDLSDAVDELGIRPVVIVVDCSPHEGWHMLDVGLNQTSPSLQSGALPITARMPSLGDTKNTPGDRGFREVGAKPQLVGSDHGTCHRLSRCVRRDSNPQPSDPKSDALSIELRTRDRQV